MGSHERGPYKLSWPVSQCVLCTLEAMPEAYSSPIQEKSEDTGFIISMVLIFNEWKIAGHVYVARAGKYSAAPPAISAASYHG